VSHIRPPTVPVGQVWYLRSRQLPVPPISTFRPTTLGLAALVTRQSELHISEPQSEPESECYTSGLSVWSVGVTRCSIHSRLESDLAPDSHDESFPGTFFSTPIKRKR